jgi:hypothetical protein
MSTPTTPRPVSELGVPLSRLAADVNAIVARQRACQVLAEAAEHSSSPSDRIAYALDGWLVRHPEAPLSSDADYPGWTPGGAA